MNEVTVTCPSCGQENTLILDGLSQNAQGEYDVFFLCESCHGEMEYHSGEYTPPISEQEQINAFLMLEIAKLKAGAGA